jgi:hypothetical protein
VSPGKGFDDLAPPIQIRMPVADGPPAVKSVREECALCHQGVWSDLQTARSVIGQVGTIVCRPCFEGRLGPEEDDLPLCTKCGVRTHGAPPKKGPTDA